MVRTKYFPVMNASTNNSCATSTTDVSVSEKNETSTGKKEIRNDNKVSLAKLAFLKASIKINKPLLPLKFALFFWFGAGANISTFYLVNLKQKGLSIAQISVINIVTPIIQCFGPPISGVIADKIGKAKPVLFAHFVIVLIFANSILFIPDVNPPTKVKVRCSQNTFNSNGNLIRNCTSHCEFNSVDNSTLCLLYNDVSCITQDEIPRNFLSFCGRKKWYEVEDDSKLSRIQVKNPQLCNLTCEEIEFLKSDSDNSMFVFIWSLICTAGFFTILSDIFRFFDITAMYMVKAHNSDFGRERFWSILGLLSLSPISGYLVQSTSPINGPKNYAMSFYVFDILTIVAVLASWKLDVQVRPPGENMLKKTIGLLRNIDVLIFIFTILTLGTTWSFMKHFTSLFLVEFQVSSMLLSLVPCVNAIYGLPFLLTSNWWVKKIGSANLLVCAFVAYVFGCTAYSFLVSPWWSLLYELNGIFTYHLLWVAVVRHSHEIAPEGLTATVISSAGGIHYAAGKGMGSLIGGLVMSQYGARWAFRVMASMCAIIGSLYTIFLYFRWKYLKRQEDKGVGTKGTELAKIGDI